MKRLNQANVPVVFVINQIDKHNEDEISFDTFKSRVENIEDTIQINFPFSNGIFYARFKGIK